MSERAGRRMQILWSMLVQTCRLMVGVPDYETYVRHRQEKHPGAPWMSHTEFFRERQRKRYESGAGKCC